MVFNEEGISGISLYKLIFHFFNFIIFSQLAVLKRGVKGDGE